MKEIPQTGLSILEVIKSAIDIELAAATRKFGPFNNTHESYAVILEELDELWDAVKANDTNQACAEAVQVGAMAMRFLFDCAPQEWIIAKYHELAGPRGRG